MRIMGTKMKVTKYEFYTKYPEDIQEIIRVMRKQLYRHNLTDNPQELIRKRKLFNQRLKEMKSNPKKHYAKMADLIRQEIATMDFQLNARASEAIERYMLSNGDASASKSTT